MARLEAKHLYVGGHSAPPPVFKVRTATVCAMRNALHLIADEYAVVGCPPTVASHVVSVPQTVI